MMLNRLSGIHCSSARSAEILSQHGVNRSRISVLPITSPLIGDIQPRPPATPGKYIVFGYLSGENFLKGYDLLIRAFSRLNSNGARLVLYGFNDAERLTRTCGHPDIVFRGPYSPEDLNRVLSEIDVGVVPSLWEEVFGLIGIEFLQAGIPVIGSRIGGIPEWLRNNEDGFHFESGHEEDLADKMKRFIDNPTLVNDMPHGTPSHDDMSCHASDVIELYRSLPEIQSAPSGGPVP
jgi:glycosyltransferase involved in cell wall biosynthesis